MQLIAIADFFLAMCQTLQRIDGQRFSSGLIVSKKEGMIFWIYPPQPVRVTNEGYIRIPYQKCNNSFVDPNDIKIITPMTARMTMTARGITMTARMTTSQHQNQHQQ